MNGLLQDLRFATRKLASSPGLTAVAASTLALGVGASAAIFSVADAVLLRPLPLDRPERVVQIRDHYPSHEWTQLSVPNFRDYRDGTTDLFRRFAAFHGTELYLSGPDGDREVRGMYASADLLRMLDVEPAAGRFFADREDEGPIEHVAILSHDFALRRFDSGQEAVGANLSIKYRSTGTREGQPRGWHEESFTVIGVLPADFEMPPVWRIGTFQTSEPQVLIPLGLWSWGISHRGMYAFPVLAELKEGASVEKARARIETIAARIARDHPDTNGDYWVTTTPLPEVIAQEHGTIFLLLGGSVGLLLLLACVNVATLLLSRSTVQRTELAVRAALGADRRRLARQILTEGSLLALLGGALGLLLAYGATGFLVSLMPSEIPRLQEAAVDLRAVGFNFGVAAVTVVLFATPAALRAGRRHLREDLTAGDRGSAGGPRRLLKGLQIAEIALAVVLLVVAGLLVHSFLRLNRVDLGIDTRRALIVETELPPPRFSKYPEDRDEFRLQQRLVDRLRGISGIEWAGVVSAPPINGTEMKLDVTLADPTRPGTHTTADWRFVTPGYLRRMGVTLQAGRYFEERDRERPVVIVDEAFAEKLWPEGDAVGEQIYYGKQDLSAGPLPRELDEVVMKNRTGQWSPEARKRLDDIYERYGDQIDERYVPPIRLTVVGVVDNVKNLGPRAEPRPQVYGFEWWGRAFTLVLRTETTPARLAEPVRAAIREVDPSEPTITAMRSLDSHASRTMAGPRFRTTLLGSFAAVALLLATVGLYGVVSYSVGRRIREMGVRQSLGADSGDILRLVLGEGMKTALWGLMPGVLVGLALSRLLESLLFGVAAADPWTYGGVCLLLLAVTALASYLPARRAVRADPVEVLRAQ